MSEIQKQLNFLKQSFPTSQNAKQDEKASFLFNSTESSKMRKDEIYLISLDGLSELITLDSRFSSFRDSLYSSKSVQFNRELQNQEINEKLDSTIEDFLHLLSPYYLLNPAHKALEFLIRVYKIHFFNVDSVMSCILPYHDHPLFSRFVHILQIKDTKWEFLAPIQESGVPLIREILVRRCMTDFSILEFICSSVHKYVTKGLGYKTLFSFSTVTVIEFIDLSFLSEIVLKRLLPFIIEGIESKEQDYKNGSLMIITQISSKIQLTKLLLEAFIEKIVKNINEYNFSNDLLTIIYLFQSQKFQEYDFKLFENIIQLKDFSSHLLSLKKYDLTNFLRYFLVMLTRWSIINKNFNMIELYSKQLDIEKHIPFMIVDIFENFNHQREKESAQLFKLLERVNARQVDRGVNHILSKNDETLKKLVMKFLTESLQGIKYVPLDTNTTLFFTLEYPDESVRKLALEKLKEYSKKASGENQKFISDSLISKLKDQSQDVIKLALQFPNLLEIVPVKEFFDIAPEIYQNAHLKTEFMKVILNEKTIKSNPKMIEFMIPYVLDNILISKKNPFFKSNYQIAMKLSHPLLFKLPKLELQDKRLNNLIIEAISNNLFSQKENFGYLIDVLNRGYAKKLFFKIINTSFESKNLISNYQQLYQSVKSNIENKEAVKSLLKIISTVNDQNLMIDIYQTILLQKNVNIFGQHIQTLFKKIKDHLFSFLSSFWMNENISIIQERSIEMFSNIIKNLVEKKDFDYQMIIPSLLVALAHKNANIRNPALKVFEYIQSSYKKSADVLPIYEGKELMISKEIQSDFIKHLLLNKIYFEDDSEYLGIFLKKYHNVEFMGYLLRNIIDFKTLDPKITLFDSIKNVNYIVDKKVKIYESFLSQFISKGVSVEQLKLFTLLCEQFFLTFSEKLKEEKYVDLLIKLLSMNEKVHDGLKPCLTILRNFNEKIFNEIPKKHQQSIFKKFFELINIELESSEITQSVYSLLKTASISSSFIINEISSLEKKLQDNQDVLAPMMNLVNMIQVIPHTLQREAFVQPLFKLLKNTKQLLFKKTKIVHLDLLMDATLSSLIYVSNEIKVDSLKSYSVDSIIDCLKKSQKSQTRNLCISLLESLSDKLPSLVIPHLPAILDILKTSLKLDIKSYEVIEKTILTILPHALQANFNFKHIAQMFINSFEFIPVEKRLGLFKSLIKIISKKKLHSFIVLFLVEHVKNSTKGFYDFAVSLMEYYKVLKQVRCAYELIKVVNDLIKGKSNDLISSNDASNHKSHILSVIFEFLNEHIMNNRFLNLLTLFEDLDNRTSQNILGGILQDSILLYSEENKQEIQEYNQKIYSYFIKVQQLLTETTFIFSIVNLLKIKDSQVVYKTLDLFNYRYAQEKEYVEEDQNQIMSLLPKLKKLILTENPRNKQSAILSIELISKNFLIPENILEDILPIIIDQMLDENISLAIGSSLSLSTILSRHNLLKFFPQIIKQTLKLFSLTFEETEVSPKKVILHQLSMLSSIELLIKSYVKYMSPYIGDVIQILIHKGLIESANKKINEKVNSILEFICVSIEPRLLLPPLFSSLSVSISYGDLSIIQLLKGVNIVLSKIESSSIDRFIEIFMKFFTSLFDVRRAEKVQNIQELENHSYETFKLFTSKLDEKLMKPILKKLIEWSKEEQDGETSIDRLFSFYKSINEIQLIFESKFTQFWPTFFESTIQDLENLLVIDKKKRKRNVIDSSSKQHQLISIIIESLKNCFEFDKEDFIHNQVRFESVLNSIGNQVENINLTDFKLYQERVQNTIVPCISQLADSVPQNFWKDLQFTFLSKLQNPLSIIKISSIKIIQGIYEKLGNSFISMLPELVPYLAEVLEDDDVEVLNAGKEIIQKIEEISGQSLEEYFKK